MRHTRRLGDRGRPRSCEPLVEEFPFGGFQNRLLLVFGRFGHGVVLDQQFDLTILSMQIYD